MVRHTPGPWFNNGGIIGPKSIYNHSDNAVCVVGTPNAQTEQDTANARLIIGAEKLLTFAQLVSDFFTNDSAGHAIYLKEQADTAIDYATKGG